MRRDDQLAPAADLHAGHALVPALDDATGPQREVQRRAAVVGGVELLAGAVGDPDVVHADGVALAWPRQPSPSAMSVISSSAGGGPSGKSTSGLSGMADQPSVPVRSGLGSASARSWDPGSGQPTDVRDREDAPWTRRPQTPAVRGDPGDCPMAPAESGRCLPMNTMYEHPSLKMHVTPEQRDRAECLAEGRLRRRPDQRGRVRPPDRPGPRRRHPQGSQRGLLRPRAGAAPSQALGVHPAYQPMVRPEVRQQAGRGAAAFAHFSVFFFWILGSGG